jgi:SHS2 domain-containing protein
MSLHDSLDDDASSACASGYALLPHTADVMVAAWAPTVEDCLAQAVRAMVSSFARVGTAPPQHMVAFECPPGPEVELLVDLLEQAIYVIDMYGSVPVQVAVARTKDGGLIGEFGVAACSDVEQVGSPPKAVTRHGLRFARAGAAWRCEVIVDV